MNILPPPLLPGDTIGVMAPSSYVEKNDIEAAKSRLETLGYKVFIHPQTYERHNQSAGNVLQKTLAFQGLWQREDINTIWSAGGGNRAGQLLESINFEKLKAKPKNLIGFSDITTLLNAVHTHTNIVTWHGPVFKQLGKHKDLEQSLRILSGKEKTCNLDPAETLQGGIGKGKLIGGCLSIFQTLIGTKHMPDCEGAILFLEDVSDQLSRFDRMFTHLRNAGIHKQISGLIIGEFLDLQEGRRPFGFSMHEIIMEFAEGLPIPILFNAPIGHGENLLTMPVGMHISFNADLKTLSF